MRNSERAEQIGGRKELVVFGLALAAGFAAVSITLSAVLGGIVGLFG